MVLFGAVLVPFFKDWGGISVFQMQLIQSWFMLWIFLLEVPTGAIADRFGRRVSIGLGSLAGVLATFIYTRQPEIGFFLVAEMVFAVGISLISGANEAWLYDTLKEQGRESQAKEILARMRSFHFTGIMIGSLLGSQVAKWFGVVAPMQFSAIPFALAAAVAFTLREPKISSGPKESQRYLKIAVEGVRYFAKHRSLRRLALDSILVHSAAYFVIWFYQLLLQKISVPIWQFGFFHAGLVLVEIAILNMFRPFERLLIWLKLPLSYAQLSAALVVVGFILPAISTNFFTITAFVVLAGGFGLTRQTYFSALMQPHIPSQQRATVISSVSMFQRLSLVILNPVLGRMADWSMSLTLIAAAIALVSVFEPILRFSKLLSIFSVFSVGGLKKTGRTTISTAGMTSKYTSFTSKKRP